MSSPEYSTVRKCTPNLIAAFESNLLPISARLFSEHLISRVRYKEMTSLLVSGTEHSRATRLADAVTTKVFENPENYYKLIKIFMDVDSKLHKDILTKLEGVLEMYQSPSKDSKSSPHDHRGAQSSASLAASLAAGAHATSGQQTLRLSQQNQVSHEPHFKDSGNISSPVTSPVDPEREHVRQKRLQRFSSGTQSVQSCSSLPQSGSGKDSTTKAVTSQAMAATSQSSSVSFAVGDLIKVSWHGEPRYGVVKWLGEPNLSGALVHAAGLEMDERVEGGHSGTFKGIKYFSCDDGHGLLLPVHKLERDDRFDFLPVVSSSPQRQPPPTMTPVAQLHVSIGRSNSSNASSSQFPSSMPSQPQGASFLVASNTETLFQSNPPFSETDNQIHAESSRTEQCQENTVDEKQLVFEFPKDRGGLIVGRDGKNVQEVERETNTFINIERYSTSRNGKGTIIGNKENCERALLLILSNLERKISNRLATSKTVTIPDRQKAGRVIGKGGRTRETIEKLSGAKLEIKKPDGVEFFLSEERHCKIIGSAKQIEEAEKLIDQAMAGVDIAGQATIVAALVKLVSHFRQMGFVFPDRVPQDDLHRS